MCLDDFRQIQCLCFLLVLFICKYGLLDLPQAKKLEANIEMTKKDLEDPTEVEVELKRRLAQLTDHLIQKQAQVCVSNIFCNFSCELY